MTVHVGELVSEVTVEPEPAPGRMAPGSAPWDAEVRHAALLERTARDACRTRAEDGDG
jgi:hypothetical protein